MGYYRRMLGARFDLAALSEAAVPLRRVRRVIRSRNAAARIALARNPRLPEWAVHRLLVDPDVRVRTTCLECHPGIPEDVLARSIRRFSSQADFEAAAGQEHAPLLVRTALTADRYSEQELADLVTTLGLAAPERAKVLEHRGEHRRVADLIREARAS